MSVASLYDFWRHPRPVFGQFFRPDTLPITPDTPTPLLLTQTALARRIGLDIGGVRIRRAGVYRVLASVQTDHEGGNVGELNIYPAVNGTPVPDSNTRVQVNQAQEVVLTVEWFLPLATGDLVSLLAFSSSNGQVVLGVPASPPQPAIPSVILTINLLE